MEAPRDLIDDLILNSQQIARRKRLEPPAPPIPRNAPRPELELDIQDPALRASGLELLVVWGLVFMTGLANLFFLTRWIYRLLTRG